ncbi:hypothetical protein, partial [uncultured Abyssibacter sp.]|uniref:hypothetical protein n=1 Tax=uncultured Abyssibacter sp. TaxID=2320202 RepID=UPI0032B246B3
LIMAGCYFYLSATVLAEDRGANEPRLLWTLPIGGLVLSIFFGEAVTRLIEVVEEAMEQIADSAPEESPPTR